MRTSRDLVAPAGGYAVGAHPSPWEGPLAALDILLNNVGVGLFLASAVGTVVAHDAFADLSGIAIPIAFVIIALDLLLLVVDLGDPFRFFHMLRVVKVRTPMSVGVWSLSLLMILLVPIVIASVLGWFTDVPGWLTSLALALTAVALLPGFGALAYKGVLFSITAQPGWRDARWLGAHVSSSGLALGSSLLLLIAVVSGATDAVQPLRTAAFAMVVIGALTLLLLYADLRSELRRRRTPQHRRATLGAVIVLGVVVPALLLSSGTSLIVCALAAASLLTSEYVMRDALVSLPHTPPLDGR